MPILLKASFMATVLFWTIILSEVSMNDSFMVAIIIFSYIPIFIVCSLFILFTIVPILFFDTKDLNSSEMFHKYFPYYSIIIFGISFFFIILSNFDKVISAFYITAFFTLMQSWIWICKTPTSEKGKTNWENS